MDVRGVVVRRMTRTRLGLVAFVNVVDGGAGEGWNRDSEMALVPGC